MQLRAVWIAEEKMRGSLFTPTFFCIYASGRCAQYDSEYMVAPFALLLIEDDLQEAQLFMHALGNIAPNVKLEVGSRFGRTHGHRLA